MEAIYHSRESDSGHPKGDRPAGVLVHPRSMKRGQGGLWEKQQRFRVHRKHMRAEIRQNTPSSRNA
jgi:hypothetical protein